MIFLSLLIYLIIWIPCCHFFAPFLPVRTVSVWLLPLGVYIIAFLISLLLIYIIHSFAPELKSFFRNVMRINSVRLLTLITGIVSASSLVSIFLFKGVGVTIYGLLGPITIVSFLNALNIERQPKMLEEEEINPKLVAMPEESEEEKPEISQDIKKAFSWDHKGHNYKLELVIRILLYENFRSKKRVQYREWAEEYVAGGICGEIRELAHQLLSIGKPYRTYDEVEFVLSFVQQAMKYERDDGEYPLYPLESLVDEGGDCEDFSILGASILKLMGYDVALLVMPKHVALGVAGADGVPGNHIDHKGIRYYYCEMTAKGWKIGQLPDDQTSDKIDVFPIPGITVKIDQPMNTEAEGNQSPD